MTFFDALALSAAGCAAGAVNAVAGGGTMLTFPVLLMCEPQAHSLFPLASWQLCTPLDSVSAYDSYSSVNSLINLLANASFIADVVERGLVEGRFRGFARRNGHSLQKAQYDR